MYWGDHLAITVQTLSEMIFPYLLLLCVCVFVDQHPLAFGGICVGMLYLPHFHCCTLLGLGVWVV